MGNCPGYQGLDLPQWLIDRMEYWSAWYESYVPEEIEVKMDWESFEAYGLSLAIDLKRIVGNRYVVYYGTKKEIQIVPFNPGNLPREIESRR